MRYLHYAVMVALTVFIVSYTMNTRAADKLDEYYQTLDDSCTQASDCEIKNVGNCCGALPACVNKNAKADPEYVNQLCADADMAGVCGFTELSGCECEQNRCKDIPKATP